MNLHFVQRSTRAYKYGDKTKIGTRNLSNMNTNNNNNDTSLLLCIVIAFCLSTRVYICCADSDNLQDVCPTASSSGQAAIFVNGYPCKNPASVMASDFKSSKLNRAGDTENFLRSSMSIVTAADFPGLNTLGLSVARTDLEVDGLVMPHAHPRASEMIFVSKGVVAAGFIDTKNKLFQKVLKEGDVFVFPRGLLHFCLNYGYELAIVFSVLNSQNPGVVSIADAMFEIQSAADSDVINKLRMKLFSISAVDHVRGRNVTLPATVQFGL